MSNFTNAQLVEMLATRGIALAEDNPELRTVAASMKLIPEPSKPIGYAGMQKVAPKGGVSTYGLGKWPITLYASQCLTFFNGCHGGIAARTYQFILDNAEKGLSFKDESKETILAECKARLEAMPKPEEADAPTVTDVPAE